MVKELSDHVLLVPFAAVIATFVVSLCLAPDIDSDAQHERWTSFFATAAQVTATLFIVLVLEGRAAARTKLLPRVGGMVLTVIYVAVGLLASGAGLSPSLSDDLYCFVFALTAAATVGAVLNVAVIGVSALTAAYAERDKALEDQIRQLYAGMEALRRQPPPQ